MRAVVSVASFLLTFASSAAFGQGALVQGAKVYETQKCSICHAIAGKGNKKFPLDGAGKKLSTAQIKEWIVDPMAAAKKASSTAKPPMKAYPALPAADLEALVAYMASLK